MNVRQENGRQQHFRYPNTLDPIVSIGRHQSKIGWSLGMLPHSHPNSLEICYLLRGSMDWWVGQNLCHLHPHDVIVTLPRVPHGALDSTVTPCDYIWIHLNPSKLSDHLQTAINGPGFAGEHRSGDRIGEIVTLLWQEHLNQDDFSPGNTYSLTDLLITRLARIGADREPQHSRLVVDAQTALLASISEPTTISVIAESLFVSEVWLTKKFRQEVGQTPAAWLFEARIQEAKNRLRRTDDTIELISHQLGFKTSQYFATAFRRITGKTPTEYRRLGVVVPFPNQEASMLG